MVAANKGKALPLMLNLQTREDVTPENSTEGGTRYPVSELEQRTVSGASEDGVVET